MLIADRIATAEAGQTYRVIETTAAAKGRDWALTVKVSKAAQLVVRVRWQDGDRDIVSQALAAGTHDVALPKRLTGEVLSVLLTPVATGPLVAALAWTPDAVVPCCAG